MSRKHFIALAAALKARRPVIEALASRQQWRLDVEAIADVCNDSNTNFDRERFLAACGVEG